MRFTYMAVALLCALVVATAVVPDAKPRRAGGWTAYAPLSPSGSRRVYEYPDVLRIAPPGAIPAAHDVVAPREPLEIQVIR